MCCICNLKVINQMGADASQLRGNPQAKNHKDIQSLANLTPAYVLKLKQRFESMSDDYNLTREGLKEFFKCKDQEVETIFRMFDSDNNGSIDSYEFMAFLTLMTHGTLRERAETLFELYDFDQSNSISKDELSVLMQNALTALKCMEGKPGPTLEEIERKTEEFFRGADTNNDQQISKREFITYIQTDRQILEVLMSYAIANRSELGTDFGPGDSGVPDCDSDLEEEANPSALKNSETKNALKHGNEYGEFTEEEAETGDQALQNLSGVINYQIPDNYRPSRNDKEAPDASLDLDYAFGIRVHDVRNNLRYNAEGKLVYNCAGLGIVLDKKTNAQSFFRSHQDDIHCLAISPDGTLCATGEIGPNPFLCVWNTKTMEQKFFTDKPCKKGIQNCAFSPCGKFLAVSDMTFQHSIYVFDVSKELEPGKAWVPIAGGQGISNTIFSLGWNHDSTQVIATCNKAVAFFTVTGNKLEQKKGTGFGVKQPCDAVISQAMCGTNLFTGHKSGEIIGWSGNTVGKRNKGHEGKVDALFANGNLLYSGGADGKAILWKVSGTTLTQAKVFDVAAKNLMSMNPQVKSVCGTKNNDLLVVSTRGGEIFEFNQETFKASVYMRGHFDLELWGLAVHPTLSQIYTFGQDGMLAVWDLTHKRQLKHCKLESGGDAIAFSNNGKYLALGFTNGTMMCLDDNFQALSKRRDRPGKAIQVLKFSPDDSILAAGGHDQLIMTYDVTRKFKPLKKLRGCDTTIWQLDFSLDGQTIICDALLFWNVQSGQRVPSGASQYKNETWSTWTTRRGWCVNGIYPPCATKDDINGVDRSPDGTVVATGDDFGLVKLFRYPCPVEKSKFWKFTGHSSHVTDVKFTRNKQGQKYLISTGGNDKTIFMWRYSLDTEDDQTDGEEVEDLSGVDTQPSAQPAAVVQQPKEDFGDFDMEEEEKGDQALAVSQFKGQVQHSLPNQYKNPPSSLGQEPENNLELKWAHGFRSFDTRNNLKYTESGKQVVFTTAGLGVVQDLEKNTQSFFNLHKEDIVALAQNPINKDIIATGQMAGKALNESTVKVGRGKDLQPGNPRKRGKTGKVTTQGKLVDIHIWKASTQELIKTISGFQRRAVRQLAFSPDGKKLLTIGEDDYHSCAIYDWSSGTKLCDAKVNPDPVYAVSWKNNNEFAVCGVKLMSIFTQNGNVLKGQKCQVSKLDRKDQIISCCYVAGGRLVTGTSQGNLIEWSGNTLQKTQKNVHQGAIWVIIDAPAINGFLTGGNDGIVKLINKDFQNVRTWILKDALINQQMDWQKEFGIRSIDIHPNGSSIIIGTKGSDVFELDQSNKHKRTIVQGHYRGVKELPEIWGCATHPTKQIFASAGADKTVRFWSDNKMVGVFENFDSDVTALDWASNGDLLAVGDRDGQVHLLNVSDIRHVEHRGKIQAPVTGKNQHNWIEDLKFSPNSQKIAVGTHGGRSKVSIISIDQRQHLSNPIVTKIVLTSALTSVDWSDDSRTVQVNSQAAELRWGTENGVVEASTAKHTTFATSTCRFAWDTQYIWPGVDYSDVNSCARSKSGTVLATGDDFGQVNLFRYPCVVPKAESREFYGHSSHVTKVRFSANDQFLISTGGNDLTVMIWQTDINNQATQQQQDNIEYDDDPDDPANETKQNLYKVKKDEDKQRLLREETQKKLKQAEGFGDFEEEDVGAGDQFLAIKPWKGQMKPPKGFSRPQKGADQAPSIKLELDWVHGYKGDSTKNNLRFMADGTVAYYIAAVGVVYNVESHQQRFFQLHTDDVTCMDFHPNGSHCLTGELGKKPVAYIWDNVTCEPVHKLVGNGITESIIACAFSPEGRFALVIAGNQDHCMAVYDTSSGTCVAKGKGVRGNIIEAKWKNETTFVLVGSKLFCEVTVQNSSFKKTNGTFGKNDQRIGSLAFNGTSALTGNIKGDLYVWNGTSISKVIKNHARLIDALTITKTHIFSGARDSVITVMDKNYNVQQTIDMKAVKTSNDTQVRAITVNARGDRMLVGTFGHEIIEVPINLAQKQSNVSQAVIKIDGHYAPRSDWTNELWGLSIFPQQEKFITCSDDGKIKVWDATKHQLIKTISLTLDKQGKDIQMDPQYKNLSKEMQGRAIDISHKDSKGNQFIAVGMNDGSLRVFSALNWQLIYTGKQGKEWIEDLKFSPDAKHLAVSGHDNKIQMFKMPECTKVGKPFGSSSSYITHLDWSLDSRTIRTNDGSYELLYYSVDGVQDKRGATNFRDEPWATNSCVLGWAMQGIWQKGQDGSDINHCDRSHRPVTDNQQLLVTADDTRGVNVYKYPSCIEVSSAVTGYAHSSHVTKARFSYSDKFIFSAGGNDTSVMQWRVVVPK